MFRAIEVASAEVNYVTRGEAAGGASCRSSTGSGSATDEAELDGKRRRAMTQNDERECWNDFSSCIVVND